MRQFVCVSLSIWPWIINSMPLYIYMFELIFYVNYWGTFGNLFTYYSRIRDLHFPPELGEPAFRTPAGLGSGVGLRQSTTCDRSGSATINAHITRSIVSKSAHRNNVRSHVWDVAATTSSLSHQSACKHSHNQQIIFKNRPRDFC